MQEIDDAHNGFLYFPLSDYMLFRLNVNLSLMLSEPFLKNPGKSFSAERKRMERRDVPLYVNYLGGIGCILRTLSQKYHGR